MLLSNFNISYSYNCFKKMLFCCWNKSNKFYLIGFIFLSIFYIYIDFQEVKLLDYLIFAFKGNKGYNMYEYAILSFRIFIIKLLISIYNDIATHSFFYSALNISMAEYLKQKWSCFHRYTIGELLNRQYDKGEAVSISIYCLFMNIITNIISVILVISYIISKTNLNFGIGMIFGSILHILIFLTMSKTLNKFQHIYFNAKNYSRSLTENESSNFNVIKTYNLEKSSSERILTAILKRSNARFNYRVFKSKNEFLYKAIEFISTGLAFSLYYNGIITDDYLDATVSQIIYLCESLRSLLKSFSEFNDHFYIYCALERGIEKVEEFPENIELVETIECENLSFSSVFSNINFKLKKYEKLAIVGANGSGKTCLLRVLSGLLDHSGDIKINGKNIRKINRKNLYENMTFISQADAFSDGTVMYNLKYGNDLTEEEIVEKCKEYDMHHIFSNLESGYYKRSATLGSELSGGQRQRISFMRGIMRKTPVLIVDDCLSGVNMHDKKVLLKKMLCIKDRMLIVVCNKLDLLKSFDKILLLKRNESKIGTFKELESNLKEHFSNNILIE